MSLALSWTLESLWLVSHEKLLFWSFSLHENQFQLKLLAYNIFSLFSFFPFLILFSLFFHFKSFNTKKTFLSFKLFSVQLSYKSEKINKLLRKKCSNRNVLFVLSHLWLFFSLEMLHNIYFIYELPDLHKHFFWSNLLFRQCTETYFHYLSVEAKFEGFKKQFLHIN